MRAGSGSGLHPEMIEWQAAAEGWYHLVVDAYQEELVGSYDLQLEIIDPAPGECYGPAPPACDGSHVIEFEWSDAEVMWDPMVTTTSAMVPGMEYVYTTTADEGVAAHSFEVPCSGTWYLWGLAYTVTSSPCGDIPDTFTAAIDYGDQFTWSLAPGADDWVWYSAPGGGAEPQAVQLEAGTRWLRLWGDEACGDDHTRHANLGTIRLADSAGYAP